MTTIDKCIMRMQSAYLAFVVRDNQVKSNNALINYGSITDSSKMHERVTRVCTHLATLKKPFTTKLLPILASPGVLVMTLWLINK